MTQDFSMRYPLVDGQGNFGSIDGDAAAAYRYTEARLAPIAVELLRDLDKGTVEFRPNFDDRLEEPEVLPAAFPQLLVGGADGIAVGMATKIPPHNLGEIVAATVRLLARPDTSEDALLEIVEGPDFPTGGWIWGLDGIEDAYRTGRGRVIMRARAHIEPGAYGKESLVITELPYQVSKQRVIESIAKLARQNKLAGLGDLRDESDRDGVRIVLELKRDADTRKLLKVLFRKTQLQTTFGVICLALVDGVPRQLGLKEALQVWIDHRLEVVRRRARHDLEKTEERAHVVEGLMTALDRIDEVVQIIRSSKTPESAAKKLRSTLEISPAQADAILAMRLARLTALESRRLAEELDALHKRIETLRRILEDESRQRDLIRRELETIAERYADARRTEILDDGRKFPLPKQGAEEEVHIFLTRLGWLKSLPARSGGGQRDLAAAENLEGRAGDFVTRLWLAGSDDRILAFTRDAQVHTVRVGDLPTGTRSSRGRRLAEQIEGLDGDVAAVEVVREFPEGRFVVTASRQGRVKRTALSEYANIRTGGIIAAGLEDDDEVLDVRLTDGRDHIVLATRGNQIIRFEETEVRAMGRTATGVKGIDLAEDDEVVGLAVLREGATLLAVTRDGHARAIGPDDLRVQGRGGKGARAVPGRDAGELVGLVEMLPDDAAVAVTPGGQALPIAAGRADDGDGNNQTRGRLDLEGREIVAVGRAPIWKRMPEAGEAQIRLHI
jgi:DNA gyrase subunit A